MDNLGLQAKQLEILLEPLAALMVKKIRPVDDELSTNAAYKTFGRGWVEEQRARGNISPSVRGNRLVWSRAELEALRAVSLQHPKIVSRNQTGTK